MSKRKLLLADDSSTIQKVIHLTFADEGIEVTTVGDGDTALEKITELEPDIVLADMHMPGLSGYRLCEIIRENERTRDLPVILLVGSFEHFDEDEASRVGASAYLTKPFHSIRDLVAQVSDLLDAAERSPEAEIPETGDIDDLYNDSFAQTTEVPAQASVQSAYGDSGMDDEMIETTYADSANELDTIDFRLPLEEGAGEIEDDDFGVAFGSQIEQKIEHESNQMLDDVFYEKKLKEPDEEKLEQLEEPAAAPFHSPFDEPAYEAPQAVGEDDSVQRSSQEPGASRSDLAAAKMVSFERMPEQTSTPRHEVDDLDLLELPKAGDGKAFEFTTPDSAAAAGSTTQVVSLSPELMEVLVQKVVEKLSEKY